MKRTSILLLVLASLGCMISCTSGNASQEDLDAVKRRLTSVEKRVKAVEGKSGPGAARAPRAPGNAKQKSGVKSKKSGGKDNKGGQPNAPAADDLRPGGRLRRLQMLCRQGCTVQHNTAQQSSP